MRIINLLAICGVASAFNSPSASNQHAKNLVEESRADFVSKVGLIVGASVLTTLPMPAAARGRATLDSSYERYTPRIISGAQFYKSDLRKMIEKGDWAGLKAATTDPPKKSKEDRSKADGGVSDRVAQAGGFCDARVLVAADLFAGAFSDNSISAKTKKMQSEVEVLREVVAGINKAAREALGEDTGGGFFGLGASKPSPSELAKTVKMYYVQGGNAFNAYLYAANDELPLSLTKLPYL